MCVEHGQASCLTNNNVYKKLEPVSVFILTDDSDEDREVSRKPRQVRQAASKAASKQREILLGGGGSEDEDKDEEEQAFMDRKSGLVVGHPVSPAVMACSWNSSPFVSYIQIFPDTNCSQSNC